MHTHTQLTHNLLTHTHNSYTHTRTQLTHPQLTYTQLPHAQLSRTQTFTLRGRRVLGDVKLHFVWQAWHWWRWAGSGGALGSCLSPWTPRLTLCGRPGAWRRRSSVCVAGVALMVLAWLWWRAWFPFVPEDAAAVCVAGVAFGSIGLHSVRQAWHLATSAWQAWRLWCWAGSGGALGSRLSPRTRRLFVWQAWHLEASASILCGRRGAWQHRPSLCVAGVALMALGWLWWRAWLQLFLEESTSILCGRPGAWRHRPSLCVASVALMVLRWSAEPPLAQTIWRSWVGGTLGSRLSPRKRGCLCGRRGIWKHRPPFCVVGVALGDIDLHLTCRGKRQPSASAKNLLPTLRSHDTLRGLLGHIAHAAKTGGCHSPLLMARRFGCGYITWSPKTNVLVLHHFCPTQLFHTILWHTHTHTFQRLLHPLLVQHHSFTHSTFTHTTPSHTHTHRFYIPHLYILYTHFFHQQHFYTELFHTPHFDTHFLRTPILHHLFSPPAFPIPFSPVFGYFQLSGPLIFGSSFSSLEGCLCRTVFRFYRRLVCGIFKAAFPYSKREKDQGIKRNQGKKGQRTKGPGDQRTREQEPKNIPPKKIPTSLCGVLVFGCTHPPCAPASRLPPAAHNLSSHNLSPHNLSTHNLSTHNLSPHNSSPHNLSTHNSSTYSHATCHHVTCPHTTHNLLTHSLSPHNLSTDNLSPHNLVTHRQLVHIQLVTTQLAHTQLVTTQLAHTQLVHTQLVTTQLTHTQLVHTQLVTTYSHTHNSLTHNFSTHNLSTHNLSTHTTSLHTTCPHTTCSHTTSPHTTCHHNTYSHTTCRGTWRHLLPLCVAGMALGDIDRHFAWQAWHLATWTITLCGRRGTYGTRLALVARLGPSWRRGRRSCWRGKRGAWRHRPSLCVAGVARGNMDGHFAWQAWRLATWTVTLHGKRGPYGTGLALVGRLGPSWRRGRRSCLRGRRGAWRHRPSLCVAGVALGDIHAASESSLSNTTLSHTHNFVTHNLSHTSLPHATSPSHLCHAQFCHTHTTLSRTALSHTTLSQTTLSHTTLSHTTLSHTQLCHRQICHTQLFHTQLCHNLSQLPFHTRTTFCHVQLFVIYNLSHTSLSQTTLSHTHNFVTGNLSHNPSHTTVKIIDPPPSPLSFLLFPCCFSHFFWLLDEIDLWDYPAL